MIVPVTSKGGGSGCTTVALLLSMTLSKTYNKSVILVDLKSLQTLEKLLLLDSHQGNIDYLITDVGFNSGYGSNIEENINHYGGSRRSKGFDVLLGTRTPEELYLLKRIDSVKSLLQELDRRYDFVILDVLDGDVLSSLIEIGLKVSRVNILAQSMALIVDYQEAIREQSLDGLIVVNSLDNAVYPEQNMFLKNFPKTALSFLPYCPAVKNIINSAAKTSGVINFSLVTKQFSYYSELKRICGQLLQQATQIPKRVKAKEINTFFGFGDKKRDTKSSKLSFFRRRG